MIVRGSRLLLLAAFLFTPAIPGPWAQSPLVQARADFEEGRYQAAADSLRAALRQNPGNGEINYWLARAEFELHEYDHATSSAERAVQNAPYNSDYHLWLGRAYGRKAEQAFLFMAYGLAKKSRREFEESVRLNPSNLDAQGDLIEFYLRAPSMIGGGDDRALQQIEALSKVDPAQAHLERANYWTEKKRPEQADEACRLALESKPRSMVTYLDLAEYFEKRKNAASLQATIEGAAQIDPNEPQLIYYRGVEEVLEGGRTVDAEQLLKRYVETVPLRSDRPSPCSARVWLGQLYEQSGRRDDAAAQYRAALAQDSRCKTAHEALRHLLKP